MRQCKCGETRVVGRGMCKLCYTYKFINKLAQPCAKCGRMTNGELCIRCRVKPICKCGNVSDSIGLCKRCYNYKYHNQDAKECTICGRMTNSEICKYCTKEIKMNKLNNKE